MQHKHPSEAILLRPWRERERETGRPALVDPPVLVEHTTTTTTTTTTT